LAELRNLNAATARALRHVAAPAAGERMRVSVPIESVAHASGVMLRLCPEVEVLAPARLRRAILERARAAQQVYAPASP
ncbi:MAG: WYL domain-containing protein, partial [Comamonadaceae bacterium]